jgi:hypothetical protein
VEKTTKGGTKVGEKGRKSGYIIGRVEENQKAEQRCRLETEGSLRSE